MEKEEKVMDILETWMNQDGISRQEQITYYKKLICMLEQKQNRLKVNALSYSVGSIFIGLGAGLCFPDDPNFNMSLGFLFILLGIVFGLQANREEERIENFQSLEEKRERIKKWMEKHQE